MITRSPYGHKMAEASIATLAALKAVDVASNLNGEVFLIDADGSRWLYSSTSVLAGDDLFVVSPNTGAGKYLRAPGFVDLALPIGFATADAAVLATLPAGCVLRVSRSYWEVTTGWAGGTASAIGLSSSGGSPAATTKGDIHGGAAGDVAATLIVGSPIAGTIGAKVAAGAFLKAADALRFDRITSAFTAGAGFAHVCVELLRNPGA